MKHLICIASLLLLTACDYGRELSRTIVAKGHRDAYRTYYYIGKVLLSRLVPEQWYLIIQITWEKHTPTEKTVTVTKEVWEATNVPIRK